MSYIESDEFEEATEKPVYDESGYLVLSTKGNPLRTTVFSEEFYQCLDPGIRFAVRVLHSYGIETCQSCAASGPFGLHSGKLEGNPHAYLEPTVDLPPQGDCDAIAFEAVAHLHSFKLPVCSVSIYWRISHGLPFEKIWRITFSKTMEDRANDKPMFIWGYQSQ